MVGYNCVENLKQAVVEATAIDLANWKSCFYPLLLEMNLESNIETTELVEPGKKFSYDSRVCPIRFVREVVWFEAWR